MGVGWSRVPVDGPFEDDGKYQIAKNRLKENHSGDEISPDIYWSFEIPCIDQRETQGIGHLDMSVKVGGVFGIVHSHEPNRE